MRILVIEPEPAITRLVKLVLSDEGYDVIEDVGKEITGQVAPDVGLILIDIVPPEDESLAKLDKLRGSTHAPIIAISSSPDEDVRRTIVELGADDFSPMPFDPDELASRVRCLVDSPSDPAIADDALHAGRVVVDFNSRKILLRGSPVRLSLSEWRLLETLAEEPGAPCTRAELLAATWGPATKRDHKFLDAWIKRLSVKLRYDASAPALIKPYHNIGYVFAF